MRIVALSLAFAIGAGSAALAADKPVVKPFTATPAGPQYFFWIEGGYSHFDRASVHAFDYGPDAGFGNDAAPVFFDIDRGWYGRGEVGWVPAQRLGWIDTISIAGAYRKGSADISRQDDSGQFRFAFPGSSGVSGAVTGQAEQDFDLLDFQLRLKSAVAAWPGVTFSAEPFIGRMNHDSLTSIGLIGAVPVGTRSAAIEGDIFGFQLAVEGQRRVNEKLTLRGRASVGGYRIDAEGDFSTSFGARDSVSRNVDGVRAGVEIGADFALAPGILLGVTGGIDHWSNMPSPRLPSDPGPLGGADIGPPVGINSASHTEYFVGVRLTLATGAR